MPSSMRFPLRSFDVRERWGASPWIIDFVPPERPVPPAADFAIVGGGFTGLSAGAWLRMLAPDKSVVVLEASRIGAGASGRTGGMVLAESAAGDLPGLGDALAGLQNILGKLEVECDLALPGAYEIGRSGGRANYPIFWNDSGTLRVVNEVPGGTLDPGAMVSGLARAADQLGAMLCEHETVDHVAWSGSAELHFAGGRMRAEKFFLRTMAHPSSCRGSTKALFQN